ncbi:glycoside hydrolase family 32 protein [Metabacillus niabensis]|uniref:Sucrose-6-phosphate hydrolase n=1 Tax=Metabacillus niabensis TaxID=324854 RepID=A0ABT9Z0N4_9BACI|nr:sucrose-6-phosphate hydrolase [Metabacillus niabensis]MDQ0225807.1 sucrose-6-phosphate hydrolase [Metabacillus niabensis]
MKVTSRFQKYSDIPREILNTAKIKTKKSPYRQKFHIEPDTGYLNDPNGFSFYNGRYHLFYQWSPIRYVQPDIWYQGWYHLVSDDLVKWESVGPGLEPDTVFDSHGPYSGSAIVKNEELYLFYTGNTRDENGIRTPYQMIAKMGVDGEITKLMSPGYSGLVEGYTDHFRDPKVWKENNLYYATVGIQRENKTGACLLLESSDCENWQVSGELKTNYNNFGYMWECPDYFELDGNGVLLFSPQGLKKDGTNFNNIYQTGYCIGKPLDYQSLVYDHDEFQELDLGFDFYATQTMKAPDGRRILSAWMGLPEIKYPTEVYGHCGCLTILRELTVEKGRLIQKPIQELKKLRKNLESLDKELSPENQLKKRIGVTCELQMNITIGSSEEIIIGLRADKDNHRKTSLIINSKTREIILDRTLSGESFAEEFGTTRLIAKNIENKVKLHIFIDQSSIEIFVNGGRYVASSRVFPYPNQEYLFIESLNGESSVHIDLWDIGH